MLTTNKYFQGNNLLIGKGIFIALLVMLFILTFKSPSLFFSSPSCQIPCAFNVVPGITLYEGANKVMGTTVKGGFITTEGYFRFGNNGILLNVFLSSADPRQGKYVQSIEISSGFQNQVLSLGDLISRGYIPQRVFRNEATVDTNGINLLMTFGESEQMIAELSPQNVLNAQSAIHNLTLSYEPDAQWELFIKQLDYNDEVSWIGYANVSDYLNLKPRQAVYP